jgi:hypothetical protein
MVAVAVVVMIIAVTVIVGMKGTTRVAAARRKEDGSGRGGKNGRSGIAVSEMRSVCEL